MLSILHVTDLITSNNLIVVMNLENIKLWERSFYLQKSGSWVCMIKYKYSWLLCMYVVMSSYSCQIRYRLSYRSLGKIHHWIISHENCLWQNIFISWGIRWKFLNQARAWFLKIDPVQIVGMHVCVCVCLHPRLLITSGMIWTSYDWLNKFYSCYMATIVIIVIGRGISIDTRCRH